MRRRVDQWKGGPLRVYVREHKLRARRGNVVSELVEREYEPDKVIEAAPYGRGLALLLDEGRDRASVQLPSGLWLDVQLREGRPQCVGVRSEEGGPEITSVLLRIPVERELRTLVRHLTVRLEETSDGEVIGVLWRGAPGGGAAVADRYADFDQAARGRRGRRPLSDEHLREVLAVEAEAKAARQPVDRTIAAHFHTTPSNARKWIYKARRRLGAKPTTEGGDDG